MSWLFPFHDYIVFVVSLESLEGNRNDSLNDMREERKENNGLDVQSFYDQIHLLFLSISCSERCVSNESILASLASKGHDLFLLRFFLDCNLFSCLGLTSRSFLFRIWAQEVRREKKMSAWLTLFFFWQFFLDSCWLSVSMGLTFQGFEKRKEWKNLFVIVFISKLKRDKLVKENLDFEFVIEFCWQDCEWMNASLETFILTWMLEI